MATDSPISVHLPIGVVFSFACSGLRDICVPGVCRLKTSYAIPVELSLLVFSGRDAPVPAADSGHRRRVRGIGNEESGRP